MKYLVMACALLASPCFGQIASKVKSTSNATLILLPQLTPSVAFPGEQAVVLTPANGAALTTALTGVACGTTIRLTHGSTYSTSTAFPITSNCGCHTGGVYNNSQWVIIESDSYRGGSVRGSRIDASVEYGQLAYITSSDTAGALYASANAAGCYWFLGLKVQSTTNNSFYTMRLGDGSFTTANFPHDMVIDHSVIEGVPTLSIQHCAAMGGNWMAVVDSAFYECHYVGADAQAITAWDGFGPWLFQNNTLQASTENTIFGGSPSQPTAFMSDITIKGNWYPKPLAWLPLDPSYAGTSSATGYPTKDSIEFKNGQRILVTGNVFDYTWENGQKESTIYNTGCSGSAPSVNTIQDVTETLNIFRHAPEAVVYGGCNNQVNVQAHRIYSHDNLFYDIGNLHFTIFGNSYKAMEFNYGAFLCPCTPFGAFDIWHVHETIAASNLAEGITFNSPPTPQYGIQVRDSILPVGTNGSFFGIGGFAGDALIPYTPGARFTNNCVIGTDSGTYNNAAYAARQNPATQAAVFTTPGSNFQVLPSSPCHGAASDGLDMGANIQALNAATAGVVQTLALPHTVSTVSPTTFTHMGGTTLTVNGTNFTADAQVIVGGAGPSVTVTSNSCSNFGQFTVTAATDSQHFTYTGPCNVVTASAISLAVNDTVNITDSGTANRFSTGALCTSPSITATQITCQTPAGNVGQVGVSVAQFGVYAQSTTFPSYN